MKQQKADYKITLDGKDLTSKIAPRLISLSLSESRTGEADTVDLVLDDSKNDLAIPKRGAVIALSFGWTDEGLVDKGTFTVNEAEHSGAPDIITVRARSASMTDKMHERREQSWHAQTLGAIVRVIAGRNSLKSAVSDALAGVAIPHIDQTHESDMSFLTRLAKRYDAVMNVKDMNLLFMPIGKGVTASGKSLGSIELTRQSGDRHRYHVSERENYAGVRAHYHSTGKAKRKSVVVGGDNNHNMKVLPETYPNEAQARAAATAELQRTERSQATMDFTLAKGRPELYPELPVYLSGFKPDIDDVAWLTKRVVHRLDGSGGYETQIDLEVNGDPTTSRHRSHFRKGG